MTLNSKNTEHRTEKLKSNNQRYISTKTKTQKDNNLVLPKE